MNSALKQELQEKVNQLLPHITQAHYFVQQALFTGLAGNMLTCFYLAKMLDNEQLYDKAFENLNFILDDLEKATYHYSSYCDGLSGFGITLCHLIDNGFIEYNDDDIFANIDRFVVKQVDNDAANRNFDFLHGGTGNCLYLLKRLHIDSNRECLNNVIIHLDKTAIISNKGIYWYDLHSPADDTNKSIVNLSLSHGLCSKIIFLSRCIQLSVMKDACIKLLTGCIEYLMSNKDESSSICRFPSKIIDDTEKSFIKRLSWCYGDLGVIIALITASKVMNRADWLEEAVITASLAMRRDDSDNGVIDCEFCHGSVGISQVFKRLFLETGNELFEIESERWLKNTLTMSSQEIGVEGFQFWRGKAWGDNYSLLEGISGIALVLQSAISGESDKALFNWDEIFLLS